MIALLLAPFRILKLARFFGAMAEDQREYRKGKRLEKLIREYQQEERLRYYAWLLSLTPDDHAALYKTIGSRAYEEIRQDLRHAQLVRLEEMIGAPLLGALGSFPWSEWAEYARER